jgi:porin
MKITSLLTVAAFLASAAAALSQQNNSRALPAQDRTFPHSAPEASGSGPIADWWNGDYATGNWSGLRDTLRDDGIEFFGFYNAIIAGNPVGGKASDFRYADDFYFGGKLDLENLVGWSGASVTVSGINRDGQSIQPSLGSQYDPMQLVGGQAVFLYGLFLEQKLLDDKISIKLGRMGASDDFATSPLYGYYLNNGIDGNIRAVLFNTRFSAYPFASWGARLRIDPTPETNAMVGIYQVSGRMFDRAYHGVDFSFRNGDGFLLLGQVGWTPEFFKKDVPSDGKAVVDGKSVTDDKKSVAVASQQGLKGHYFLGGYWSSWDYPQFGTTETAANSYGFYLHGDQMVYLEAPGSDQGLTLFTTFTLSPQQNVAVVPFQVNGGAIYKGLLPARDEDRTIFGVIYGQFSNDYARSVASTGAGYPRSELVFEWGYRVQLNKWAYIQPDVQWVINPGGTGNIPNGLVLGAQFGVKF